LDSAILLKEQNFIDSNDSWGIEEELIMEIQNDGGMAYLIGSYIASQKHQVISLPFFTDTIPSPHLGKRGPTTVGPAFDLWILLR